VYYSSKMNSSILQLTFYWSVSPFQKANWERVMNVSFLYHHMFTSISLSNVCRNQCTVNESQIIGDKPKFAFFNYSNRSVVHQCILLSMLMHSHYHYITVFNFRMYLNPGFSLGQSSHPWYLVSCSTLVFNVCRRFNLTLKIKRLFLYHLMWLGYCFTNIKQGNYLLNISIRM